MHGCEADQDNFSKHDKRGDLRAGSDKCRARNRCPLVGIRRPQVEWRSGDFEGETDEGHHDTHSEQWLNGSGA
jgi:hypothetical protein